MPNLTNAKKALRQSIVRGERNSDTRAKIEYMRRNIRKLLEDKKADEAKKLMPDFYQALDKAVTKNVMKANTVARVKGRTMKAIVKMGAAK